MKRITYLITGGAGNIGSALASRLSQDKHNNIIIVDNLSTGGIEKLPEILNLLKRIPIIIMISFPFLEDINLILFFILQLWLE
jgi:nucleoside-diphosphate-sugar epimerase